MSVLTGTGVTQFVVVTGAPRSGTTFISDWITECRGAYCVHEVMSELIAKDANEILGILLQCARTGRDRIAKLRQREFIRWDSPKVELSPWLLALKQPVIWTRDTRPYAVDGLVRDSRGRYVVLVRHPIDVVASGRRRAQKTKNWPGFSVEEHCAFWLEAIELARAAEDEGIPVTIVRQEELLINADGVRQSLSGWLNLPLRSFTGHEYQEAELSHKRSTTTCNRGSPGSGARSLLTPAEIILVRKLTEKRAQEFGYVV